MSPHTKKSLEELREEWKKYAIDKLENRPNWLTPAEIMTAVAIDAANWWLSKISSLLDKERTRLMEIVKNIPQKYSAIDGKDVIRRDEVLKLLNKSSHE